MIRVVAYNVSGGVEVGAVSEVLGRVAPDVVCVVEAPPRGALRRVARRAGLTVASRAGRGRLAVAVLVGPRVRVLSADRYQLTVFPSAPRRYAAQAIVAVGGVRLAVVAVQLGMRPEVREAHAADVEDLAAKIQAPIVVAGDLNESPSGLVAARFAEFFQDAFAVAGRGRGETYPNPDPSTRRSYVFVDRSLAVLEAHVPLDAPVGIASHHLPVIAAVAAADEDPAEGRGDTAAGREAA